MFYNEGDEALAEVAQRDCKCPILETFKVSLDGALSNQIELKISHVIAENWF